MQSNVGTCYIQSVPAPTVGAERDGQADHTDKSAWAHHTRSKETTLAARSTPGRLQAGHVHVQRRCTAGYHGTCRAIVSSFPT